MAFTENLFIYKDRLYCNNMKVIKIMNKFKV